MESMVNCSVDIIRHLTVSTVPVTDLTVMADKLRRRKGDRGWAIWSTFGRADLIVIIVHADMLMSASSRDWGLSQMS